MIVILTDGLTEHAAPHIVSQQPTSLLLSERYSQHDSLPTDTVRPIPAVRAVEPQSSAIRVREVDYQPRPPVPEINLFVTHVNNHCDMHDEVREATPWLL